MAGTRAISEGFGTIAPHRVCRNAAEAITFTEAA